MNTQPTQRDGAPYDTATSEPTILALLEDWRADDLMTPNPVSICDRAIVKEAAAFLLDKRFSAAPVIDNAGRPVGVLSNTDIVRYEREKIEHVTTQTSMEQEGEFRLASGERIRRGFQLEGVDGTEVRQIMTPIIFSVTPDTPADEVIQEMLARKIHRVFVVDRHGVLVGVISPIDIMRKLVERISVG